MSPPSSSTPTSATGPPGSVHLTSQGSFLPLYPEGGWARFTPTPEDPDAADRPGLVVRSLGADAKVDVLRVQRWAVNAFVAERFRHGRTLPAGDAVHAIPPAGGLGMNLGVAGRQRPHRALDAITPG
ncbi:FAD-dependent monooxygenase [Streptomyces sp. bgisy027]|uniref:FAD-dependent monooxygenase n=1 Tax=unclassified Streptomyces TaxID=2593676 RepID=UPI003D711C50